MEALSLLTPGRGLRGAGVEEIQQHHSTTPWAIAAKVETRAFGTAALGTGRDPQGTSKRIVRVNGAPAKNQSVLAEYLACVWLTPQMDRLFIESAGTRRRFLDRLVFAFDPGHAGRVSRYENAMSQRAKILREEARPDGDWLRALEATMAETGVAIAVARHDFIRRLQQADAVAQQRTDNPFPRAILSMQGTIDALLGTAPAVEVEQLFKYQLAECRAQDAMSGGAATGPHRSDFTAIYAEKEMPADQCSTGEQKALLIGIVLAHARLVAAEKGAPPILLLDEVVAHLDANRRQALFALLTKLGGQVWLTGTDAMLFDGLDAARYEVQGGVVQLTPVDQVPAPSGLARAG